MVPSEGKLRGNAMVDAFEDHCWKDLIPADVLEIYSHYRREVKVGPRPALLAIDLYNLASPNLHLSQVMSSSPSSVRADFMARHCQLISRNLACKASS